MGLSSTRNLLYLTFALQLISTFERQIFDFLGYMWVPILGNFVNSIFIILGIFGTYQYQSSYLISYLVWTFIWIGWNAFIICFYLNVGSLNRSNDILSFGTGSYSWWLVNGFGCRAEYFANTTEIDTLPFHPVRPTKVTGCVMNFQHVEVTHAAIQIGFAVAGIVFGSIIANYFIKVVNPRCEKQAAKVMYSIEYSPQVNESSITAETDLYANNPDNRAAAAHMTPRRVKRRSYTRSSARSANTKSLNRTHRNTRSTRSAGAAALKASKNPVTRLMDAGVRHEGFRADSSTSNDDRERYGQVNPGFQSSRPNSVYSQATNNNPTDLSRPPSALTSYSNFHGHHRRPNNGGQSGANHGVQLTQESLIQYNAAASNEVHNPQTNTSIDDLPPPPPPLSSSPALMNDDSDSVNTSSLSASAHGQVPVPQQRMPRRNEYVNMPIPPPHETHLDSGSSQLSASPVPPPDHRVPPLGHPAPPTDHRVPPTSSAVPPPLPPHNYVSTNPAGRDHKSRDLNSYVNAHAAGRDSRNSDNRPYSHDSRTSGMRDGLRDNHPYNRDSRSSNDHPHSSLMSGVRDSMSSGHQEDQLSYGDTQTLRADAKFSMSALRQSDPIDRVDHGSAGYSNGNRLSVAEPQQPVQQQQSLHQQQPQQSHPQQPAHHQQQSLQQAPQYNGYGDHQPPTVSPPAASEPIRTREITGHQRRDIRSSLRAKHKKEMEERQRQHQQQLQQQHQQYANYPAPMSNRADTEDDYGFTRPASRANGGPAHNGPAHSQPSNGPLSNGHIPNGLTNGHGPYGGARPKQRNLEPAMESQHVDDKWYLHDSMKPVGAARHGPLCKCYRCQRKLTAI